MSAEAWVGLLIGVATIFAIIQGPIIALRIQRHIEEDRETRNRKLWIFKTLMSNRATRMSPIFVQALNLIDVEFTLPPEKPVRDAWREAQDHYTDWGRKTAQQREAAGNALAERAEDLLSETLVRMGNSLGYAFDKVYVKKGWYYPEGLGNIEQEQHALRKGMLRIISGYGAFPVAVFEQKFPPINAEAEPPKPVTQEPPKQLDA
jgi:hypothetical protein